VWVVQWGGPAYYDLEVAMHILGFVGLGVQDVAAVADEVTAMVAALRYVVG
jgi:hypothetical protein